MSTTSAVVRCTVSPCMSVLAGPLAVDRHVDAVVVQDALEEADIGKPRHVSQGEALGGEQAGDHERQGRVLGAADGDVALQDAAAADANLVHRTPTLIFRLMALARTRAGPFWSNKHRWRRRGNP